MQVTEFEDRAQTNIRLYGQLLSAGHSMQQVSRVRAAYTLATQLFAGQLRPEGRPFVCHLVGVASILAMLDAPPATVIAGLLHSAYTQGDFGIGRGRMNRGARDRVRVAVDAQIEHIVAGYSREPWNAARVAYLARNVDVIDAHARQIVLIRLTNTLEDALDRGLKLSAKSENPNRAISVDDLVKLANALGHERLGEELRRVLLDVGDGMDLTPLRESHLGSSVVGPSSWREKVLPRIFRYARTVRGGR